VFRKLLERESELPPWRELFYVYRRLEARGEIRGGRFVSGFAGEQFALADAASMLRKVAKDEGEELVAISAADPLNLVGVILPGEKVPALPGNRLLLRNGVPVAIQTGRDVRYLQPVDSHAEWEIRNLLIRRQKTSSYFDMPGAPQWKNPIRGLFDKAVLTGERGLQWVSIAVERQLNEQNFIVSNQTPFEIIRQCGLLTVRKYPPLEDEEILVGKEMRQW